MQAQLALLHVCPFQSTDKVKLGSWAPVILTKFVGQTLTDLSHGIVINNFLNLYILRSLQDQPVRERIETSMSFEVFNVNIVYCIH